MESLLLGIVTVAAWGLWLIPSQNLSFSSERVRSFYVTSANLIFAIVALVVSGSRIPHDHAFGMSLGGGFIWYLGSWAAFVATQRLGVARAMGIWSPLNILTACLWGALLFHEFSGISLGKWLVFASALVLTISGILMVVFSQTQEKQRTALSWKHVAPAVLAGLVWGSYFVPLQYSGANTWSAAFPMAVGMWLGSVAGLAFGNCSLKLPHMAAYGRALASGFLWSSGNYASLLLMERIGTGKGFTVAQLCIVVNALAGVYLLKNPRPGSKPARLVLAGVTLACMGGIVIGAFRFD